MKVYVACKLALQIPAIGEWRIGWWATRSEACEAADRLRDAIQKHTIRALTG